MVNIISFVIIRSALLKFNDENGKINNISYIYCMLLQVKTKYKDYYYTKKRITQAKTLARACYIYILPIFILLGEISRPVA